MERINEVRWGPNYAQNHQNENGESSNSERLPTNVSHEIFNQNELLKRLLQDDIAEGM